MKQTIHLNENELKQLIKEAINELSPELLMHASDKALVKGKRKQCDALTQGAWNAWRRDYGWVDEPSRDGYKVNSTYAPFGFKVFDPDFSERLHPEDAEVFLTKHGTPAQYNRFMNGEKARERMNNGQRPDGTYYIDETLDESISRAIRKALREGMEPEETWYVQETIGGWRQNPIFSGTYDECLDYMGEYCNNSNSSYALVPDSELEVDYLNDEE